MSRSISIWYVEGDVERDIEIGNNDMLGTQAASMKFWALPILKELGLVELTKLAFTDPITFQGHQDIKRLEKELNILEKNKSQIPFHTESKERWIRNLRIALDKLQSASSGKRVPHFMIG